MGERIQMESLPPESDPEDGPTPVLDYAQPRGRDPRKTADYVGHLTRVVCMLAVLPAIPFAYSGIVLIWRWAAGTDSADVGDGVCFLVVGALLFIAPVLGWRAASR
jgi:hypothetical protein